LGLGHSKKYLKETVDEMKERKGIRRGIKALGIS
jgi:hypothetical protein